MIIHFFFLKSLLFTVPLQATASCAVTLRACSAKIFLLLLGGKFEKFMGFNHNYYIY